MPHRPDQPTILHSTLAAALLLALATPSLATETEAQLAARGAENKR
ncbi:hypothetical protein SAMN05216535_3521 [Stutzerimonas xanthomarina]|uniref:Uncharacterized protein n=1 Tax=Stutzerimonas xanthomarina TaxID=271420 RepID=A0ABY0ZY19_9GAMM|nr:hypothetical protein SAMN05216535_3521 [Stutzerimonas xanthomarina]